jgi:hypothetical protein
MCISSLLSVLNLTVSFAHLLSDSAAGVCAADGCGVPCVPVLMAVRRPAHQRRELHSHAVGGGQGQGHRHPLRSRHSGTQLILGDKQTNMF